MPNAAAHSDEQAVHASDSWRGITQAGRERGEKTADWRRQQGPPAGDPGIPERRARQLALDLLAERLELLGGVR